MNRQTKLRPIKLRPIRRPKTGARDVRQEGVIGRRYLRNGVNGLCTIGVAKYAAAAQIKARILLQIVRPIGRIDRVIGAAVGFNCVLVDSGVDHTQIVKDSAGLGTFTSTEESGHCDRRQERDDRNNNHDLNERKSFLF